MNNHVHREWRWSGCKGCVQCAFSWKIWREDMALHSNEAHSQQRRRKKVVVPIRAFRLQIESQNSCSALAWLTKNSIGFAASEFSSGIGTAFNSSCVNSNSASLSIKSRSDICLVKSSILFWMALTFSRSNPKTPGTDFGWGFFLAMALCWAASGQCYVKIKRNGSNLNWTSTLWSTPGK